VAAAAAVASAAATTSGAGGAETTRPAHPPAHSLSTQRPPLAAPPSCSSSSGGGGGEGAGGSGSVKKAVGGVSAASPYALSYSPQQSPPHGLKRPREGDADSGAAVGMGNGIHGATDPDAAVAEEASLPPGSKAMKEE